MEVLATICQLMGGVLVALAGLGLIRLPDPLTRASAVSKAAVLGVALILLGALLDAPSLRGGIVVLAALVLHLITVPLGGLALGKAAYRSGTARPPVTQVDEPAEAGGRAAPHPDEERAP